MVEGERRVGRSYRVVVVGRGNLKIVVWGVCILENYKLFVLGL